jgi:hypothetical protein
MSLNNVNLSVSLKLLKSNISMKYFILSIAFSLSFLMSTSCTEPAAPKAKKEVLPLKEVKNGVFYEYYPGRKAIKIKGPQNSKGQRNGRWLFYAENGVEMSMTEFSEDKKQGFTFVRYPNGQMRYTGEYADNKEIGVWRFYKEDGTLDKEISY